MRMTPNHGKNLLCRKAMPKNIRVSAALTIIKTRNASHLRGHPEGMTCRQWQGVCAFRKGVCGARLVLVEGPKRMMGLSWGFKGGFFE
jgi:hypothetical protein